jgi:hypothetical protein
MNLMKRLIIFTYFDCLNPKANNLILKAFNRVKKLKEKENMIKKEGTAKRRKELKNLKQEDTGKKVKATLK